MYKEPNTPPKSFIQLSRLALVLVSTTIDTRAACIPSLAYSLFLVIKWPIPLNPVETFFASQLPLALSQAFPIVSISSASSSFCTFDSLTIVNLARLSNIDTARVLDRRSIAIVLVHTRQNASSTGLDAIQNHLSRANIVLAVTAAAINLSESLGDEVLDVDCTPSVVLDDLVSRTLRAAVENVGGTGALEDGESVFADFLPPDVVDGARAVAVDAFGLVRPDDAVLQSCTAFEDLSCRCQSYFFDGRR